MTRRKQVKGEYKPKPNREQAETFRKNFLEEEAMRNAKVDDKGSYPIKPAKSKDAVQKKDDFIGYKPKPPMTFEAFEQLASPRTLRPQVEPELSDTESV